MLIPLLLAVNLHAQTPAATRRVQYVMGTACDITAYGPQAGSAIGEAFSEIARWDRVLSLYKEDSEAVAFNRSNGGWFACSESFWEALTASLYYAERSNGAFDPTILAVLRKGPAALPEVGYKKIELNPEKKLARFRGLGLDFGGIGKGIALDHAVKILRERGVVCALINFGGQIYALGAPPDASAWTVHIDGSRETLFVRDASVSTSGNAERPGHIRSPFTGEKIMENYSASVIAASATEADAWSTALFVLGPNSVMRYDGCSLFSGARPEAAPACSRYLEMK